MTDFFEKIKKGMDSEEPSIKLASVKPEEIKKPEEIEVRPPKKVAKKKVAKKKLVNKIEIKTETEDPVLKDELENKRIEENLFDGPEGELTVDVYQSGNDLIVRSAIAGVDPEDLDITIENDLVIISGQREQKVAEEKDNYFFQECYWGRFKREIILPVEVDSSRANAKMEKGILIIKIPIIEERKKKTKISIE